MTADAPIDAVAGPLQQCNGGSRGHEPSHPANFDAVPDLLGYVADMIGELEEMAESTGCPTLHGLLSLARAEALLRRDDRMRQRRPQVSSQS